MSKKHGAAFSEFQLKGYRLDLSLFQVPLGGLPPSGGVIGHYPSCPRRGDRALLGSG